MTTNNQPNVPTAKKQGQDGFFVISMSKWQQLFEQVNHPINALRNRQAISILISYLVLACGTGGDHITSTWSARAIRTHTGVSPKPATNAIQWLADHDFLTIEKAPQKNRSPRYKLHFDESPKSETSDNIYLPSGLVVGVAGEHSPLGRLYGKQDIYLLYLFIRLYGFMDKYLDVIEPCIISSLLNEKPKHAMPIRLYNESGLLTVWGVTGEPNIAGYSTSKFFDFSIVNRGYSEYYRDSEPTIFDFTNKLTELGLLNSVSYICMGNEISDPNDIDFVSKVNSTNQQNFIEVITELATGKGYNLDDIDYTDCFILPADYEQIHIATFYQMQYRTSLGESIELTNEQAKMDNLIMQNLEKCLSR